MNDRDLKGKTAISGLGVTEMGRVYGHSAGWFAAEAIRLALDDAGLRKEDIDGLLVNQGVTPLPGMGGLDLQNHLGLTGLRLLASMNAGGATAGIMVQYAAMAIAHGMANHVVCVFADAPLREGRGGGAAYGGAGAAFQPQGMRGLYTAFGMFGVNAQYAIAARRHMGLYGTTNDHFGAIAVAQRQWAAMNPPRSSASRSRSRTTMPRAGWWSHCTYSTAASYRTAASRSSSRPQNGRAP